ncbi:RNA-binding protein [Candidatus Pacearchaeota archaeon]|nr:RNA-binding protein [Candidatus Pacearchaeota archaeon]
MENNELITIIDEKHNKPIGIGLALFSGKEMQRVTSGKVVKNLHYVGDKIWNYS